MKILQLALLTTSIGMGTIAFGHGNCLSPQEAKMVAELIDVYETAFHDNSTNEQKDQVSRRLLEQASVVSSSVARIDLCKVLVYTNNSIDQYRWMAAQELFKTDGTEVQKAFVFIANNPEIGFEYRLKAAEMLDLQKRASAHLSIAGDLSGIYSQYRTDKQKALITQNKEKAIEIYWDLAKSPNDYFSRTSAAKALSRLHTHKATEAYLSIIQDPEVCSLDILKSFAEFSPFHSSVIVDAYMSIATGSHKKYDIYNSGRREAAKALIPLNSSKAIKAYLSIHRDLDPENRAEYNAAADRLISDPSETVEVYESMVMNPKIYDDFRFQICTALVVLGEGEKAVNGYFSIAMDPNVSFEHNESLCWVVDRSTNYRLKSAEALVILDQSKAAEGYLSIARDPEVFDTNRLAAAKALVDLDEAKAAEAYTLIARSVNLQVLCPQDKGVSSRMKAAQALEKIGKPYHPVAIETYQSVAEDSEINAVKRLEAVEALFNLDPSNPIIEKVCISLIDLDKINQWRRDAEYFLGKHLELRDSGCIADGERLLREESHF